MAIAITGGAGYIGSHTVKRMLEQQFSVVVFDNLSRGHREAVPEGVPFERVDLMNPDQLKAAFSRYDIDAVVHFAAFAYVGESTAQPEMYFYNNTVGSLNLLRTMRELGIPSIVFSSTCSLYGNPSKVPIDESAVVQPINPYARSKAMVEQLLQEYELAYNLKYVALRYFNAAGASVTGGIGESHDPEPHLIPIILSAAAGKRTNVTVFGDDYPTADGTCIRDYIHVDDLADAHISAVRYLLNGNESTVINLGTGTGNSVLEVIRKTESITGKEVPFTVGPRREGDPAVLVADNQKAHAILGWKPQYGIETVIESAWKWHQNQRY